MKEKKSNDVNACGKVNLWGIENYIPYASTKCGYTPPKMKGIRA